MSLSGLLLVLCLAGLLGRVYDSIPLTQPGRTVLSCILVLVLVIVLFVPIAAVNLR